MRASVLLSFGWTACVAPTGGDGDPTLPPGQSLDGGQFGNEGVPEYVPPVVALFSGRAFGDGEPVFLGSIASGTDVPVGRVLAAVDLDGDGAPELGVEVDQPSRFAVFSGRSVADALRPEDATAVIPGAQDPEDPPRGVGDLDGDGLIELAAWSGADPSERRIAVYSGAALLAASGAEVDPWLLLPPGPTRLPVSLADIDADGSPELVVAEPGAVTVLAGADLQTGGDLDHLPLRASVEVQDPASLAEVGDLDGDGALDLAVGTGSGEIAVYSGRALLDGGDPFAWATISDTPVLVPLGDLDGDDRPDLGVRSLAEPGGASGGQVGWLSGASLAAGGEQTLAGPHPIEACSVPGSPLQRDLAVDLDGDGVRDWVYLGDYVCLVSMPTLVEPGDATDLELVSFLGYPVTDLAAVRDLDGDDVPDLAATLSGTYLPRSPVEPGDEEPVDTSDEESDGDAVEGDGGCSTVPVGFAWPWLVCLALGRRRANGCSVFEVDP